MFTNIRVSGMILPGRGRVTAEVPLGSTVSDFLRAASPAGVNLASEVAGYGVVINGVEASLSSVLDKPNTEIFFTRAVKGA